jgi:hypothetical protein
MKKFIIPLGMLLLPLITIAQGWPEKVTIVEMNGKDSVIVPGDLAKGEIIDDLTWAWSSSNACFPATQSLKFRGNHVFFATTMRPQSIMKISVTPTDPAGDLSIYAYRLGTSEHYLVPDLPSCITCEADHKWDRPWKNRVQTHERKLEFQNPSRDNSYNILIGVSAPKGVTTGDFNLKIKVEH